MSGVKIDRIIDGCGVHRSCFKIAQRAEDAPDTLEVAGRKSATRLIVGGKVFDWTRRDFGVGGVATLRALAHEILYAIGDLETPEH